jgi:hypothetical protein
MVRFLSASAIGKIVNRVGRDRFCLRLIDYLERDFRRWESFEKAPRLASHSKEGADELEIDDEVDLIARPDDPKNLFAPLRAPQTERSRQWALT